MPRIICLKEQKSTLSRTDMLGINFLYFKNHSDDGCRKFRRGKYNYFHKSASNYFVQHIIPRMITAIASMRTSHSEGRQIVMAHPMPKAIHKKSLLHIFFTVTTPLIQLQLLHSMKEPLNRYSKSKELCRCETRFQPCCF